MGISDSVNNLLNGLSVHVLFTIKIILLMGALNAVNALVGWRLNILGIFPRKIWSLPGIVFSPFLHGSFNHFFFNAIPLFVLMNLILLQGMGRFIDVTLIVIGVSGILLWLFGRKGLHVGASGVIAGYFSYVIVDAYQEGSLLGFIGAGIVLYYFSGILLSIFPSQERVSWEGHLFGFIAGLVAVFYSG